MLQTRARTTTPKKKKKKKKMIRRRAWRGMKRRRRRSLDEGAAGEANLQRDVVVVADDLVVY